MCTHNGETISRLIFSTNSKCNYCWMVPGHKTLIGNIVIIFYYKKTIVEYFRLLMRKTRQFIGTAVSVNIFSMKKLIIEYTVFLSPCGDGKAIFMSSSKLWVGLAPRVYPWTSCSVESFIQHFLGKNQGLFKDFSSTKIIFHFFKDFFSPVTGSKNLNKMRRWNGVRLKPSFIKTWFLAYFK